MNDLPGDLYYTNEHEWLRKEEDGSITVGITDYAQNELGDIIFIEFPSIGLNCIIGDTIGTLEAVKTVSDVFSPLIGKIAEINNNLIEEPDSVNKDPYHSGWMIKLDSLIDDQSYLLSANEYKELIR